MCVFFPRLFQKEPKNQKKAPFVRAIPIDIPILMCYNVGWLFLKAFGGKNNEDL